MLACAAGTAKLSMPSRIADARLAGRHGVSHVYAVRITPYLPGYACTHYKGGQVHRCRLYNSLPVYRDIWLKAH
jgi:hypothetical protein